MLKDIYRRIVQQQALTKPELAQQLEMSLTAVSEYVNQLERLGWVEAADKAVSTGGRRAQKYVICPEKRLVLGVDIRRNHAYLFFADLLGQVLFQEVLPMADRSYPVYMEALTAGIQAAMERWEVPRDQVLAAGLSISGITDWSHQVVSCSVEMGWEEVPLGLDLRWRLGISSFVDMDVRILARTQIHPTNPRNAVGFLFVNRGIGLALIVNNEVYRGYSNRAGENRFFYPSVFAMERFIEQEPIIQRVVRQPYFGCPGQDAVKQKINLQLEESLGKSVDVRETVEAFARESAQLMYSLTSLINPRRLVLGGGIFDYVDTIFSQTQNAIDSFGKMHHRPEVLRGSDSVCPLERGITVFVLEKFHALKQFEII